MLIPLDFVKSKAIVLTSINSRKREREKERKREREKERKREREKERKREREKNVINALTGMMS